MYLSKRSELLLQRLDRAARVLVHHGLVLDLQTQRCKEKAQDQKTLDRFRSYA